MKMEKELSQARAIAEETHKLEAEADLELAQRSVMSVASCSCYLSIAFCKDGHDHAIKHLSASTITPAPLNSLG